MKVTRFLRHNFKSVPGTVTRNSYILASPHMVSGPAGFYTTVFPVLRYPLSRMSVSVERVHRMPAGSRFWKGENVTPEKTARPYGIVATGILSGAIALMSSRLDRVLFYFLASGSILLALTFSSVSLDSVFRRFRRASEPIRQPEPATSGD